MSCGAGHRCGLDLALLWLWCGLAAVALIQPLAWELSYAIGAALKKKKEREKSPYPQDAQDAVGKGGKKTFHSYAKGTQRIRQPVTSIK